MSVTGTRQYETAAAGGKDMEAAMSLPTVKFAVESYLAASGQNP